MSERKGERRDDELVGRLIETAGRGPTASAEAKARVYSAVHSSWSRKIESAGGAGVQASRRARFGGRVRGAVAAAAAVGAVAVTTYWMRTRDVAPSVEIGRVARVEGSVRMTPRDGARRAAAPSGLDGAVLMTGDALATASDGRAAVDLDDDLVLRVNADSEVSFSSLERIVVHAGTVYVDTGAPETSGRARPLELATRFGTVEHRGTQYEVHVDEARLRIRVREGRVSFGDGSRAAIGQSGEQLVIGASGTPVRSSIARHDAAWDWAVELATLEAAEEYGLADVLSWVARETGRDLEYETPAAERHAASLDLHGLEGLSPPEALDVIRRTTGLDYRLDDGGLLVR